MCGIDLNLLEELSKGHSLFKSCCPTEKILIHAKVLEKSDFWYKLVCFHFFHKENYVTDLIFL